MNIRFTWDRQKADRNRREHEQSIALKPAEESFLQGWQEALWGETLPISELWTGIEA